jgi:hypothetical protein
MRKSSDTSTSPLRRSCSVLCGLSLVLCIEDVDSFSIRHHVNVNSYGKHHSRIPVLVGPASAGAGAGAGGNRLLQSRQRLSNQFQYTTTTQRSMSLIPLPVEELDRLVAAGAPTASQYSSYWGRTKQEQYGRFLESAIVTFLGVFFSYFMSFVLGGFIATLFGTFFVFYGILSPEFKAYQRNWEFLGGRQIVDPWTVEGDPERAGLYGALFLGRIGDVCVVEDSDSVEEFDLTDFADYSMETDELERYTGQPYLLRVDCVDSSGRELQLHARLSEEYLDLEPGMPVTGVLLSMSPKFTRLAALTDLYVPGAACWIGDYPYLDRAELEALLADDDEIWDALQQEELLRGPEDAADDDYDDDDVRTDVDDSDDETDRESSQDPVYARRKRGY